MNEFDKYRKIVNKRLEKSFNTDKDITYFSEKIIQNKIMSESVLSDIGVQGIELVNDSNKITESNWNQISNKWFDDKKKPKIQIKNYNNITMASINLKSYPYEFDEQFKTKLYQLKDMFQVIPQESIEFVLDHIDGLGYIHHIVMQLDDVDDFLNIYEQYLKYGDPTPLKKFIKTPSCIEKSYVKKDNIILPINTSATPLKNIIDKKSIYNGEIKSKYFTLTNGNEISVNCAQNLLDLLNNILDPLYDIWIKRYPKIPIKLLQSNNKLHKEGYAINISIDHQNKEYKRKMNKILYKLIVDNFQFYKIINFDSYDNIHISYKRHDNIGKQIKVL